MSGDYGINGELFDGMLGDESESPGLEVQLEFVPSDGVTNQIDGRHDLILCDTPAGKDTISIKSVS